MNKTFSSYQALREGAQIAGRSVGAIIVYVVVVVVFLGTFGGLDWYLRTQGTIAASLMVLALGFFRWLISIWLSVGLTKITLLSAVEGELRTKGLFSGLRHLLWFIVVDIIVGFLSSLSFLPGMVAMVVVYFLMGPGVEDVRQLVFNIDLTSYLEFVGQYGGFMILELIILGIAIIPPFLIAIYLGFAKYLIVDKRLGPLDALSFSSQVVRGAALNLINFSIVFLLINIAGFLCLIVGLLITIPVSVVAYACVYRDLLRQTEAALGRPLGCQGITSLRDVLDEDAGQVGVPLQ